MLTRVLYNKRGGKVKSGRRIIKVAAGMHVAGVYDPTSEAEAEAIQRTAHHYVRTLYELTALAPS